MKQELIDKDKSIYCMSFKWLQTPVLRKELLIFEPEADIATRSRPFNLIQEKFEERSWRVLQNYDHYGYPAVDQLESWAHQGIDVNGCGLKFEYSMTLRKTKEGKSYTDVLYYWKHIYTGMYRSDDIDIEVKIGNTSVIAIPYDVPVTDNEGREFYKVRLWGAKPKYEYDWERLPRACWEQAVENTKLPKDITEELFLPQQMTDAKKSCLKQKYFMVSATVQWAIKKHMSQYHNINTFHEKNLFVLCDAWSELAIPELIRIFHDEYGVSVMDALKVAKQVCSYLENDKAGDIFGVWKEEVISSVLPRIYEILKEIE